MEAIWILLFLASISFEISLINFIYSLIITNPANMQIVHLLNILVNFTLILAIVKRWELVLSMFRITYMVFTVFLSVILVLTVTKVVQIGSLNDNFAELDRNTIVMQLVSLVSLLVFTVLYTIFIKRYLKEITLTDKQSPFTM